MVIDNTNNFYKCSPSKRVIIMTLFGSVCFIILLLFSIVHLLDSVLNNNWIRIFLQSIFIITLLACYSLSFAFSPKSVILKKDFLLLQCHFFSKKFYYSDIKSIHEYYEVQNATRHFGSNGIWGYIGILDNGKFKYYSLTNNEKNSILINTYKKHYVEVI